MARVRRSLGQRSCQKYLTHPGRRPTRNIPCGLVTDFLAAAASWVLTRTRHNVRRLCVVCQV